MPDSAKQKRGRNARLKGARFEREVVALHHELGLPASKVPLSGALVDHPGDVKIGVLRGLIGECKDLKQGLKTVERWLAGADVAFSNRFRKKPLVHMRWETYVRLISVVYQLEEMDRAAEMARGEGPHNDREDQPGPIIRDGDAPLPGAK